MDPLWLLFYLSDTDTGNFDGCYTDIDDDVLYSKYESINLYFQYFSVTFFFVSK